MNLGELIEEARTRCDDVIEPYFTPDATFARWATEGEREAAAAARLLFDDGALPGVTRIDVVPGEPGYAIDPLVYFIDAATFVPAGDGRPKELTLVGLDWVREQHRWMTHSNSRPGYLADNGRDRLRIYPVPSAAGTVQLAVYRYPLYPMEVPDDEPEIAEEHHVGLVDWMVYRYYSQKDVEKNDPELAAQAQGDFERRFGRREQAGVMRRHRERRRVTTRYGGIR